MANQISTYQKFGVYDLDYEFFEGWSMDATLCFLISFGWDKGYILHPQPNEKEFLEKILEQPYSDILTPRKLVELYNRIIIKDEQIDNEKSNTIENFVNVFNNIQMHKMEWESLGDLLKPWFQQGLSFQIVDPYFFIDNKTKWIKPLKKIFNIIKNRPEPIKVQIYRVLHRDKTKYPVLSDQINNELIPILNNAINNGNLQIPTNCTFELWIWKYIPQIHDRFLIIDDKILISFSHGFDEVMYEIRKNSSQFDYSYANIAFHNSTDLNIINQVYNKPRKKLWATVRYNHNSSQGNPWTIIIK